MDPLRCAHCGDVIGVYEPTRVTLADGTTMNGACLTLRPELDQPDSVALHEHCYRALQDDLDRN